MGFILSVLRIHRILIGKQRHTGGKLGGVVELQHGGCLMFCFPFFQFLHLAY